MNEIDSNGNYILIPGTLAPQQSSHPAWQARIALALYQGAWLWAPISGSTLNRFQTLKQTPAREDEFQKELVAYLQPFGPEVVDMLAGRGGVEYDLTIPEGVLP